MRQMMDDPHTSFNDDKCIQGRKIMPDCERDGKTEGHSTCEYGDADATLTRHSEPNISSAATNERGTANSKRHKIVL